MKITALVVHNVAWAEAYLPTKWHLDPSSRLATTDMGRKLGGAVPLIGGAGSPSNAMWPERRPTSMPSFILIHPTVWPQYTNVTDRTGQTKADSMGQTVSPNYQRNTKPELAITHPAVWPQQTWAENWGGCAPYWGSWVPI